MPGTEEKCGAHSGKKRGAERDTVGTPRHEFEVVLLPDGNAVFSWNSPEIQEMAGALGLTEFETPRWCG